MATRAFLLLACLASVAAAADLELVLQDGHDGYFGTRDTVISVDPRIANRNLGGEPTTWIWQFDGIALVEFDFDYSVIPADAVIKQATLELYCVSVGFSPEEIRRPWEVGVYEFQSDWCEGSGLAAAESLDGATLKTSNGRDAWPNGTPTASAGRLLGAATLQGPQHRWYKWSLDPAIVNEWVSSRRANYGMLVWGKAPGKAASFASREAKVAEQRPVLRLRLANTGKLSGQLNAQRLDAAKLANDPMPLRGTSGLGISREQVLKLLRSIDEDFELTRRSPVLLNPLYTGSGSRLNANIAGPREDVVEVSIMFEAAKGDPATLAKEAGVQQLLALLQPDWKDAVDWVAKRIPEARDQPFKEFVKDRGAVIIRLDYVGGNLFLGVETKKWRFHKAPE